MDLVNKDIGLFKKLANQHNLQIDLGKILQKKFKKGLNEFGSRSFSTSIVKLIEDQGRIKMRAKNFPKELIDNFPKQKGIEV